MTRLFRYAAIAFFGLSALFAGADDATATTAAPAAAPADSPCPPPLTAPTQEQAVRDALRFGRDRGALWRITRDGRSSYLYGSIHVGRYEWIFPGPTVIEAFRNTDVLGLEIDLLDPKLGEKMNAAIAAMPQVTLSPELRTRFETVRGRLCIPESGRAAFAQQNELMQLFGMNAFLGAREGITVEFGQEMVAIGVAVQVGRPIVGLETIEDQLRMLTSLPSAELPQLFESTLTQIEQGDALRTLTKLASLWETGDIETLGQYESWCACVLSPTDRAMLKAMNDDRNVGMADSIERLHASGKRAFVAVGVLHMTGEKALPSLMAARGFTVERVAFRLPPTAAN